MLAIVTAKVFSDVLACLDFCCWMISFTALNKKASTNLNKQIATIKIRNLQLNVFTSFFFYLIKR